MSARSFSLKRIKEFDKSDMLGILLDFPQQCQQALEISASQRNLPSGAEIKNIIFAGVGGSAIGADLVESYLFFDSKVPIVTIREYELPAYVNSSSLVFVSSYSGNTEETLNAYQQARKKGAQIIALSSGGKLKECSLADGVTFIQIPGGLPSRCAIGFLSIIPLCLIGRLGLASDVDPFVRQAVGVLQELKDNCLNPGLSTADNVSKFVALKLYNKFPAVYSGSVSFEVIAVRLRSQLNENAKTLALSGGFPEVCHNEIMGWQNPGKLIKNSLVIMLRDKTMDKHTSARMEVTKEILKRQGVDTLEIWSRGEGLLSRIFSLVYIGDFISFYLAILYGLDPYPIGRITELKKKLIN